MTILRLQRTIESIVAFAASDQRRGQIPDAILPCPCTKGWPSRHPSNDASSLDPKDSGPERSQATPPGEFASPLLPPNIRGLLPSGESASHPRSPAISCPFAQASASRTPRFPRSTALRGEPTYIAC